ncbi:MAG TPA: efflux RND transporter periplasmic adaptor subunit [Bryobacteraceae bacterium]|jgi:multidrug efflux system membrane fusion protein|nr:efflux RND transporter periplasmic adaptor subunit [Bryobacteraceae bacterium]
MIESTPPTSGDPSSLTTHELPPAKPRYALPPAPPQKPPSKLRFLWWLVLIVLVFLGYKFWPQISSIVNAPPQTTSKGGGGKKGGRGGGNSPVVATRAHRGSIPVYDNTTGSVTPIYTTIVQSRVVGELMEVHYKEGDLVKKGDVLMQIDPRPYEVQLQQAQAQMAKDQAALKNAIVDQDRYNTLLKQNAIPEQTKATQDALVDQDRATIQTDEAQIAAQQLNITYCRITADISGRLGLRLVDPGNIIQTTTNLVVITQIQPISVIFPLSEDQLPAVYAKMRGNQQLTVEAWNRDSSKKLATGKLTTIDNQIDQTTGTVRMRAQYDNSDNSLFPNQFVNVRLLVQEKTNVVLLSSAGVQLNGSQAYVWMVKPDSTVTVRNITTGTVEGNETEITSGLQSGDEVVMTGVDKLQEGEKVVAQVQGEQGGGRSGAGKKSAPGNTNPPGVSTNVQGKRGGGKKQ